MRPWCDAFNSLPSPPSTFLQRRKPNIASIPDCKCHSTQILSLQHLLGASFLALHHTLTNTLKARTPHSELVFRLHPNNNIGESYQKFGISDTTETLIAVKLSLSPETTSESVASHLRDAVKGESVEIGDQGEEIGAWTDLHKVSSVYKLDTVGGVKPGAAKKGAVNGEIAEADKRKEMEAVILGIMTIKGS
jgi:EKC/KEOPS complex subunit CGI121/TPRKB